MTAAVNWVALAYVVASGFVPKFTVDPSLKPAPVTVRVKSDDPAWMKLGEIAVSDGVAAYMLPDTTVLVVA